MEKEEFESKIKCGLDHLLAILKCDDSDVEDFTFHVLDGPGQNVSITAYFSDGGMKNIIISDGDIATIVSEVLSCIGGPRVYILNEEDIVDELTNLEDTFGYQLTDRERAAIDGAIRIILDDD